MSSPPSPDSVKSAGSTEQAIAMGAIIRRRQANLLLSALLAVSGALAGLVPYVVVYLVANELFLSGRPDRTRLLGLAGWAAVAVLAKIVCKSLANAVSHAAAYRILADLRHALADRLAQMPLGRVRARSGGQLKKVLQDDVEQLELGLSHAIPDIAAAVAIPLASLAVMFWMSWQMGMAALAVVVLAVALVVWAVRRSAGVAQGESAAKEDLNTSVVSFVRGMRVIRGFLGGRAVFSSADDAIKMTERIENLKMSRGKWQAVASTALIGSSVLFLLPVGLWCVSRGLLSPSALVFFLLVGTGFAQPLMGLMISLAVLQYQVEAGVKAVDDILTEPPLPVPSQPRMPDGYDLELCNASFTYPARDGDEPNAPVVRSVQARIPYGASVALVGPSGAGKSTLLGLLARFHDVTDGSVTFGGVDLREMDPVVLMQHVAFVQQDDYLFADTIMENIRLARPEATDEEVRRAAEQARVTEIVEELEDGWSTVLPPGGGRLSGGQRQRISVARALLKQAKVVLLDEATAFLDPENEEAVGAALAELRSRATMITVAHRLGSVVNYDRILFMVDGAVVDAGTHQQLLMTSPGYTSLWEAYQATKGWELTGGNRAGAGSAVEMVAEMSSAAALASPDAPAEGAAAGAGDPDEGATRTPLVLRLGSKGAAAQWLSMLGDHRSTFWRRGLWRVMADGFLTSAPVVVILFALLEVFSGAVRPDAWWRYGAALAAIFAVRWLVGVSLATTWWPVANRACSDLRRSVLHHLRRIPLGDFDQMEAGRVSTLVVSDLPLVDFVNLPARFIVSLLQPTMAAVVLCLLDWRLALAALAGVPLFALLLWWADRVQAGVIGRVGAVRAEANSTLLELVQGTAVLRANPRAPQAGRYKTAVEDLRRASVQLAVRSTPLTSLATAALELGFALMILAVCLRYLDGGVTQAVAVLVLVLSLNLYRPYQELMDLSSYRHLQSHIAERLGQVWDLAPLPEGTRTVEASSSPVVLDDVTFSYRDGRDVLRGVSLVARAGTVTALVGPSGAGKSTVANLVARFWDVDHGSVKVGDVDVRELTTQALAGQVTTVYQDVYLFPTTVRENLLMGAPQATEAQITRALRAAQAWDFVEALPRGLNTVLREGGTDLSGGQRQRLSIARALLKDAPVLLLDEAVASVDPETEVQIQRAISELARGRTVMVVAHRLNTIRSADQIVVLADNRIDGAGTHDELLASSVVYRRLWAAYEKGSRYRDPQMDGRLAAGTRGSEDER